MLAGKLAYFAPTLDADAAVYIAAVETADGQSLETAVRTAINNFVVGCKADGIWSAMKASCILMGARTLSGALTPLVGTAPTNNNFVSGDYNRKTGLVGNGSTKWLNSNRNCNADGQNDFHGAVYVTTAATVLSFFYGAGVISNGSTNFFCNPLDAGARSRNATLQNFATGKYNFTGFGGTSRSASGSYAGRVAGTDYTVTSTSQTPYNGNFYIYSVNGLPGYESKARMTYYSLGSALTLANLDTRVSDLYTAIGAAI